MKQISESQNVSGKKRNSSNCNKVKQSQHIPTITQEPAESPQFLSLTHDTQAWMLATLNLLKVSQLACFTTVTRGFRPRPFPQLGRHFLTAGSELIRLARQRSEKNKGGRRLKPQIHLGFNVI